MTNYELIAATHEDVERPTGGTASSALSRRALSLPTSQR
jgi:hypothetical protein